MIVNFNIGLLGHVDSGKTTLARALSTISSTAAFDKNPQSQERGITLDLGFSALLLEAPARLKADQPSLEQLQFTFVDCPGHASLIRTIIGGAQIIDLMLLVIDAKHGVQTQTAECIVIGELLKRKLIVVVNKIDLLPEDTRQEQLNKINAKLRKTLAQTRFDPAAPIFNVSALENLNIKHLLAGIVKEVQLPVRVDDSSFLMFADHCFSIKGQGTVCTGTIVQGKVSVNDMIEIPCIREQRKVKSIQMFHRPVQSAAMGDRIGLCVTQFNAKMMERGMITEPGYLQTTYAACIKLNAIRYYKFVIRSKSKLHITVGHDTVMATVTLLKEAVEESNDTFDLQREYEYIEELDVMSAEGMNIFALLEFQTPILVAPNATLIAAKLDLDLHSNCCRLAFWGRMQWCSNAANYATELLPKLKVFKRKCKEGSIQRLVNEQEVIVHNLFKKQGNRAIYVGKKVELSSGEVGVIESTFGQTSKVKVIFANGMKEETLKALKEGQLSSIKVYLKFKTYVYNKHLGVVQ